MFLDYEAFPSEFAKRLGISSGLLTEYKAKNSRKDQERRENHALREDAMRNFQSMATCTTFKDAMIAWYGIEISKEQKKILKTIYKSTLPWALGDTARILLTKINSAAITGRDANELAKSITELLGENAAGAGSQNVGSFTIVKSK